MLPEKRVIALASRSSELALASSSSRRRRSAAILRLSELFSESSVIAAARTSRKPRPFLRLIFERVAPSDRSPYVAPLPFPGTRAPVAQLDRAPDYESGGQRFESFRARHFPLRSTPMRRPLLLTFLVLSACSAPGGPYPSLQPRAAEAIDPRVPVTRPMNQRPVAAALASRLAALVGQAHSGDAAFDAAASQAERLAAAAGAPQSDSWMEAEEALR